jgi:hypothetical protein
MSQLPQSLGTVKYQRSTKNYVVYDNEQVIVHVSKKALAASKEIEVLVRVVKP